MDKAYIEQTIKDSEYLKEKLFFKGFLITDDQETAYNEYPFYGNWSVTDINSHFKAVVHKKLTSYFVKGENDTSFGIFGNAYNPFSGEISEKKILTELSEVYGDQDRFIELVNQLTGVFCLFAAEGGEIKVFCDPVGLKSVFYGRINGSIYISTHTNLIGDLKGLEEDPRVTKLKKVSTFPYFGNQLPGNITSFKEVRRLNPNHYVTNCEEGMKELRFYTPKAGTNSVDAACEQIIPILTKTMELIARKWARPAISLTGGCDSKTTLAGAKNVYDKYCYFSYDSQPNELPDALAAKKICEHMGLEHTLYKVPYEDKDIEGIEDIRAVLMWNGGNVRANNANDVRKRAYLDKVFDFDIEVKSWASEVGRTRYIRRFNGRRNFGKPTPRKCTTLYKFLPLARGAVRRCDRWFKEYLELYMVQDEKAPIAWQEQFYWEYHWPSCLGLNLTAEQEFSNDVTVPYNNRILLELLLSVSEEDRINDSIYTKVRQDLDPRIDEAADTVIDVNHTDKRARRENAYYVINNLLPF